MTYDQWKDPTEDATDDETARAEYEAEMLIEYAVELDGWELVPDWQSAENQNRAVRTQEPFTS